MNKYENLYVINAELTEEEIKSIIEKFAKVITDNGGEIEQIDEWGKRRLAYPINDMAEGYYVLMNCECKPELPAELDRVFKITEGILRSLIVCVEE